MKREYTTKKKSQMHILFLSLFIAIVFSNQTLFGATVVSDMTVNYAENPIGIERDAVLFSWKIQSNLIGQAQVAYQISVSKEDSDDEIWNSGTVDSDLSIGIAYKGPELELETRYLWNVEVTCANGETLTSKSAYFETGTNFDNADWIHYIPVGENVFEDSLTVQLSPTILSGGFTLYFGIKNDNNRFAWNFTENSLSATKVNENGSSQLDTVDLTGIISLNASFDLTVNVTDDSIITLIDGTQISKIENSYSIELPYVGVMVAPAQTGRRGRGRMGGMGGAAQTTQSTQPAQSAVFNNFTLTVDGQSEQIGETSFTLTAASNEQSNRGGFGGFGGQRGGRAQGVSFIQTEYRGRPVEFIADTIAVPMFRTEQQLDGTIESARLYITALGIFDAYINGREVMQIKDDGTVMDDAFSPGWTNYNDYIYYRTYDVTSYLDGENVVLGARLGTGWYAGRIGRQYYSNIGEGGTNELALLAKLVINYTDGSQDVIVSNTQDWVASEYGPILSNDFFIGEIYDARLEAGIENWNNVGFDDSDWGNVSTIEYAPRLIAGNDNTAYMLEEDRVYPRQSKQTYIYDPENIINVSDELAYGEIVPTVVNPTQEIRLEKGKRLIVDIGQNIAGVTSISMSGSQGTQLKMRGAEMLNDGKDNPEQRSGGSCGPKGTLYWYGLTRGRAQEDTWYTDTYYLNDKNVQNYRASLTFHGFRYLEVWADNDVVIHSFYAQPVTSAVRQTGFIETNNENVNKLFNNTLWSQIGNFLTIPTDCPNRSERLSWSGDVTVFTETSLYNFDAVVFLNNYLGIASDYAKNNGGNFGTTMPGGSGGGGGANTNAGWTDVGIVLSWALYQHTGDRSVLENNYYLLTNYVNGVMEEGLRAGWGDHVALQTTSGTFMAGVYQAYDALIMSKIAETVGNMFDAKKYMGEYERMRDVLAEKYVDDEANLLSVSADNVTSAGFMGTGIIQDNSQTSILWALKMGLYNSEAEKEKFIKNLLTNIDNAGGSIRNGQGETTLSTGFLGVNVLLPVLTENGLSNTAYDLLLQDEMPSWLYEVKNGATTTWERWNGYSAEDSFGDYGMNSFNHYAYGAVGEWMFEYMAGIQKDEAKPGFKNVILQPTIDRGSKYNDQPRINQVNGRYDSYYGTITSNWTSDEGNLSTYEAVIPANTTATLYLPLDDAFTSESMSGFESISGVTYEGIEQRNGVDVARFNLLAGGYSFELEDGKLVVSLLERYINP